MRASDPAPLLMVTLGALVFVIGVLVLIDAAEKERSARELWAAINDHEARTCRRLDLYSRCESIDGDAAIFLDAATEDIQGLSVAHEGSRTVVAWTYRRR